MPKFINLRQYLDTLRKENEIVDIYCPVDPHLEIAEIHRRVIAKQGPALFFHRVKGSCFPVVTNLFGTQKRVDLAFGGYPENLVQALKEMLSSHAPFSFKSLWQKKRFLLPLLKKKFHTSWICPVLKHEITPPNLEELPLLQTWPKDGGHFITLPLVYTENPQTQQSNLGIYRIQRFDTSRAGLHWQIAKGGGYHFYEAEKQNIPLPVSIFIGGPPALILSALLPLPENMPELIAASVLMQKPVGVRKTSHPHPVLAECEFALQGFAYPHVRKQEGPFGDHYGYYSLEHEFPVFECQKIYHRDKAIFPATVVGKPRQEDFYLGEYLQKLFSPLFSFIMPTVKELFTYGDAGFHSLAAAVVQERFYRESMISAFRILGEGQLSLSKVLLLTDASIALKSIKTVLTHILERLNPETDLYIFADLCLDTLDYTGPALNKGSRAVFLGMGRAKRKLPSTLGTMPNYIEHAAIFCPGCLVISLVDKKETTTHISSLLQDKKLNQWPLIIIVDNVLKATKNESSFLWTVFTRFEPAQDMWIQHSSIHCHHLCYAFPIVINAQMKSSYPEEVLCDPKTQTLVSSRWHEYFPKNNVAMGNSASADVY